MNEEEQLVYDYLLEYAVGKQNSKTSDEINHALDGIFSGRTNEPLREIISNLIFKYDKVIGAGNKVYWLIDNEEELLEVENNLQKRANGNLHRKRKLRTNWEENNA